ncbi:MAG TPA: rod shape-determining protein MreC [Candidatus Humimicrobiaceae bacterium]
MAFERKNVKSIIVIAVIIVLCIIIITVSFRDSEVFNKTISATLDIFKPVQEKTFVFFQKTTGFFFNISDYFKLNDKVKNLENENSQLLNKYSENINLKTENDQLRGLLGMSLRSGHKTQTVRVIGYYENSWQSRIVINSGKSDGVLEGMAVANEKGLIGIVILASNNSSEVRLLNDPQSSIGARILSSRKLGLVEGSPDKKIYLNYIDQNEDIFKGDVLITTEFGENMPAEILIGRIKKISISSNSPYKLIEVEPFADYKRLEYALVIKE